MDDPTFFQRFATQDGNNVLSSSFASTGTLTPVRRRRSDTDVDGEEEEENGEGNGVEREASPQSRNGKRARLDEEREGREIKREAPQEIEEDEVDGDDMEQLYDASQSPQQPLLPDSFRRSPKGKARATGDLQQADPPREHQPGSIVRVMLTNFVTYSSAEFHPGPNLNMIIGPNGTGKSTLVCAICLGLGWKTSHLGRAKDIGEFVKHGAKTARIEIELAADPARHAKNPVIGTKISRENNKAEFYIDGKKATQNSVTSLARSFSIQVDNLCQFLPQDRVVEFAALSPIHLLAETQRAAAPESMSEWHDQLKEMRKQQKKLLDENQSLVEILKNMNDRQRLQEGDVVRLRERAQLQGRATILERLRPFPLYMVAKRDHAQAKERRKLAEKELKRLEQRMEPNLRAANEKQEYSKQVERVVDSRGRLVGRQDGLANKLFNDITTAEDKIEVCRKQIQSEKDAARKSKEGLPRLELQARELERAIQNPPETFDPAQMNEMIREKRRLIREIDSQIDENQQQIGSLGQQTKQRGEMIIHWQKEKESLRTQAGQQANKLRKASKDAATAWDWIQANRDCFQGDVFGPPIVECSLKDQKHAMQVESMIPQSEMTAFTVTTQEDFKKLGEQLYGTMGLVDINIRTSLLPLDSFKPPCSDEDLQSCGLESWLLNLLEGPEPVLAMLCDNRMIHATGFTSRDITDRQFQLLTQSVLTSWVTSTKFYRVTRRREYGAKATSTKAEKLRPARFLTETTVDQQQDTDHDRSIVAIKEELKRLLQESDGFKEQVQALNRQRRQLEQEEQAIRDEKNSKQSTLAQFNALPTKLEGFQRKIAEVTTKVERSNEIRQTIEDKIDKLSLEKGQRAIDYANALEQLRGLHVDLFEAQILSIEAQSDFEQLEARNVEEREMLSERRQEVDVLTQRQEVLLARGRELQDECRRLGEDFTAEISLMYENEVMHWDPEQLETEIQSVQARLNMTDGAGNQHILREYEDRAGKIERRQARKVEVTADLEDLELKIRDVREQWEPQLDELISQISEAFADNFAKIQCAGEVTVHKDEDFEQWAIQIKVKFRENEPLSLLDSHRQSGGERAVSTIFYLMALQSLARAPFRVVDEINQGMDPRNERMVHSRMVDIACGEGSASQYFLITPKLLSGLKYHPSMKVHCIASGEWMPADHRELDFGLLARKALAIRANAGELQTP